MAHYLFLWSPNILLCAETGTGTGSKSKVKLKFCAQPMHQIYVIKYCILLKLFIRIRMSYQVQVWLFTVIVSRFVKSHCLLKSSVPFPLQPNLIKILAAGEISKLMVQTREPIPTYTLHPVSLLWAWHFKHGAYATNFLFPLLIMGWNIIQRLGSSWSHENFLNINNIYFCVSC